MFEHPDLDGKLNRLLGRALLELRDPNDGFLPDPGVKSRIQFILCDGLVYSRRLPPGETPRVQPLRPRADDCYMGRVGPSLFRWRYPGWHDSIIDAWRESVYPGWPPPGRLPLATVAYTAHAIHIVTAGGWPESVTCPDCGGLLCCPGDDQSPTWLRACDDCGGRWRIGLATGTGDYDQSSGAPLTCWTVDRIRDMTR